MTNDFIMQHAMLIAACEAFFVGALVGFFIGDMSGFKRGVDYCIKRVEEMKK